jgi:uncharacterized protein (DUF2236 family)
MPAPYDSGILGDVTVPVVDNLVAELRSHLADRLIERVAGPEGPRRRDRINGARGPRWFEDDRPIRRVHGDAAMFVGGIRALLLQSLHPLAMAGVVDHSGFQGDPWGRLQRTSHFLAVTTFGSAADAASMVGAVRRIHERVVGVAPDGRPYSANDPHLLRWVHVAEIDSFLRAHQRYGARPLDQAGRDGYVADAAVVAEALGVVDPPRTEAALAAQLAAFRPELEGTSAARETARFLLLDPPLPLLSRGPYTALAASAVSLLPWWARRRLLLPYLPVTEAVVVRAAGAAVTRTIRWAMTPPR